MLDDKKLLYIPRRHRLVVSISLSIAIVLCTTLVYVSATSLPYAKLLNPAVELLKLLLTGSAAWGLVVLYASANSAERIGTETDRFFREDMLAAFRRNGFMIGRLGNGKEVCLLRNSAGTSLYRVSIDQTCHLYLWCRLNVNELSVVFLIDPTLADSYERFFQASLQGFASQDLVARSFGVQKHDADGALPEVATFLEIYVVRKLPNDFLFDAGSRYATANSLYGDARSLAVEAARAKTSLLDLDDG